MKFELYDNIKLNKEVEALAACGIHEGCFGTILQTDEEKSLVVFFNREDMGDHAFAWVKNNDLDFYRKQYSEETARKMAEWFKKQDPAKKPRFREKHLQELDMVKVLAEKPEYAKNGVHKGMVGTILDPRSRKRRYDVLRTKDGGGVCLRHEGDRDRRPRNNLLDVHLLFYRGVTRERADLSAGGRPQRAGRPIFTQKSAVFCLFSPAKGLSFFQNCCTMKNGLKRIFSGGIF